MSMRVSDFRKHAEECRQLAGQSTSPDIREQLLKLAETWDELAQQRAQELARKRPAKRLGRKPD